MVFNYQMPTPAGLLVLGGSFWSDKTANSGVSVEGGRCLRGGVGVWRRTRFWPEMAMGWVG